tara:strand:+ start:135 stop:308 length:174 start_codon:yes stop_codon:yes gene_type:complete
MDDLYEALNKSIDIFTNQDRLNLRQRVRVRDTYAKYVYNYDTIQKIINLELTEYSEQ